MKTKLKIKPNSTDNILSATLYEILNCIDNPIQYNWKILWFEGTWSLDTSIIDFENNIKGSKNGVLYNFDDLIILSNNVKQIFEILLIGSKNINDLIRYDDDKEMYRNCKFIIELIDSSYWEIVTDDILFAENLLNNIQNSIVVEKSLD